MGVPLAEALGQVDLEAGYVGRCQVNGYWVEVRVLGPTEAGQPAPLYGEDVRLDPWAEFPLPAPTCSVVAEFVPLPAPDVPQISADEDVP